MRKLYPSLILLLLLGTVKAQSIYYQSFSSLSFPTGWVPNDSRVVLVNNTASSGYNSSPTSPPASGGINVLFQHCSPSGSTITLTASGVISTTGKSNIRVGFGLRNSNSWDSPVLFEWSSDGANWNIIDTDVSSYAPGGLLWGSTYFDLPSDADNVANLRFRFSFVTTTNQNCTAPPNFRIDDFIVGSNSSLPVELTTISAYAVRENVHVSWSTASETDNSHFNIERSPNGREFTEIGRVAGAGTVREKREYTFVDEKPLPGANYYRLRQVDMDGRFSFSPVRRVVMGTAASPLSLFPSPADEYVQVQWAKTSDTDSNWEIFDTAGRRAASGVFPAESTEGPVFVGDLQPGAYFLRIVSGQETWTQAFVKQ